LELYKNKKDPSPLDFQVLFSNNKEQGKFLRISEVLNKQSLLKVGDEILEVDIKKEDYDKEVEDFYKKLTEGRIGNYFVIVPNWGNSYAYSQITFYKQEKDRVVSIDELSSNKKTLTEFCNVFNDVLKRREVDFKVEKCGVDRKKFKKFDKFLHLKAKYTKRDKIFESYFIDYKGFQIKVEILVHKQDYERIEGSLRYMIDTIN
jgi:hypothetical protein